jgi:hypothetical protein
MTIFFSSERFAAAKAAASNLAVSAGVRLLGI